MGLATFGPYNNLQFSDVDDKDASLFPVLSQIHPVNRSWPSFTVRFFRALVRRKQPATPLNVNWTSIVKASGFRIPDVLSRSRTRGARPLYIPSPFSDSGISLGTAKNRRRHAAGSYATRWLIIYHGVSDYRAARERAQTLLLGRMMMLSKEHPQIICYRSTEPVLTPSLPQECHGTVAKSFSPAALTEETISGCPTVLTCTMAWRTTVSA